MNHKMTKYPRICIVGLKCYDLLSGAKTPRYIGGIENQLVNLARGLIDRGFPVSFITFDHGQSDGIEHDGIRIHQAFVSDEGIPVIRFVHPRWTGLCSALARADADIYYQMGAGCETGQVAMWCRKKQKHFIFATASDADCVPNLPLLKSRREKYLYRYGLNRARMVISQTQQQQRLLLAHHGISSKIIRIMSPQPQSEATTLGKRKRIIWVGRISPEKRPHLLLDIARRLPEYTFDLIGEANADTEYAQNFRQKVENNPSIILHGKVSNELLNEMYNGALLLIGTSRTEGFPVTFVEAWSRGIPVVSTFDPDRVIAKYNLGWTASSADNLVSALKESMSEPKKWKAASESAKDYYAKKHSLDSCMEQFTQIIRDVDGLQSP